jgi:predicted transcriptional regulator
MSWSKAARARVGLAVFERYAAPVRAFPERHHPLRVARVAAGWTQVELAAATGFGWMFISRVERGVSPGSARSQHRLAAALGKTHQELFGDA